MQRNYVHEITLSVEDYMNELLCTKYIPDQFETYKKQSQKVDRIFGKLQALLI